MSVTEIALPDEYRIWRRSIPFFVPGFNDNDNRREMVFTPEETSCPIWFAAFRERVLAALGRTYLPICRISDGEMLFMFGPQRPSPREQWVPAVRATAKYWITRLGLSSPPFRAATARSVSSGAYSASEWSASRLRYGAMIKKLAGEGLLAVHLSYGEKPFQERYFPAMRGWFLRESLSLTTQTYVPFYFVYGLLTGPGARDLFGGMRVGAVNGAVTEKRAAIVRNLEKLGASSVHWLEVSPSRTLFDELRCDHLIGKIDLCLVGAGVGKPNILLKLAPLGVPCIDAGYFFEVLASPNAIHERRYCRTLPS